MPAFVAQHSSEIVTSIISIAITLAAGWYFWRRRPTKTLDWALEADTEVVSQAARTDVPGLRVCWVANGEGRGRLLTNPRLVLVRIINTGRRGVGKGDYEDTPVTVKVPGAAVISATITRQSCSALLEIDEFPVGGDEIKIRPGLVNPSEWFRLRLILDGGSREPVLETDFKDRTRPMRQDWHLLVALLAPAAEGVFLWKLLYETGSPVTLVVATAVVAVVLPLLVLESYVRRAKSVDAAGASQLGALRDIERATNEALAKFTADVGNLTATAKQAIVQAGGGPSRPAS